MNAIEQWKAKNAPYNEGVLLYASFPSHNKVLLKNFQKKQSAPLHEKLKYELSKIQNSEVKSSIKQTNQKVEIKINIDGSFKKNVTKTEVVQYIEQQEKQYTTKQALYFHELPSELRPILLEANTLFKEMCLLKVKLNELPSEAETKALELQLEISTKQKKNALCWEKLDYYQKHKTLPKAVSSKFEKLTPANLVKQEKYLDASKSKMKKRLASNKELLKTTVGVVELNKLQRSIAKQESNLIAKDEELIQIKALINGN